MTTVSQNTAALVGALGEDEIARLLGPEVDRGRITELMAAAEDGDISVEEFQRFRDLFDQIAAQQGGERTQERSEAYQRAFDEVVKTVVEVAKGLMVEMYNEGKRHQDEISRL